MLPNSDVFFSGPGSGVLLKRRFFLYSVRPMRIVSGFEFRVASCVRSPTVREGRLRNTHRRNYENKSAADLQRINANQNKQNSSLSFLSAKIRVHPRLIFLMQVALPDGRASDTTVLPQRRPPSLRTATPGSDRGRALGARARSCGDGLA